MKYFIYFGLTLLFVRPSYSQDCKKYLTGNSLLVCVFEDFSKSSEINNWCTKESVKQHCDEFLNGQTKYNTDKGKAIFPTHDVKGWLVPAIETGATHGDQSPQSVVQFWKPYTKEALSNDQYVSLAPLLADQLCTPSIPSGNPKGYETPLTQLEKYPGLNPRLHAVQEMQKDSYIVYSEKVMSSIGAFVTYGENDKNLLTDVYPSSSRLEVSPCEPENPSEPKPSGNPRGSETFFDSWQYKVHSFLKENNINNENRAYEYKIGENEKLDNLFGTDIKQGMYNIQYQQ